MPIDLATSFLEKDFEKGNIREKRDPCEKKYISEGTPGREGNPEKFVRSRRERNNMRTGIDN